MPIILLCASMCVSRAEGKKSIAIYIGGENVVRDVFTTSTVDYRNLFNATQYA